MLDVNVQNSENVILVFFLVLYICDMVSISEDCVPEMDDWNVVGFTCYEQQ